MIENTRRILRSLYVACAGPGDDRECTYGFMAMYDCLRAFYGGGGGGNDVHAQLSDTGCLRVYGVYTGWKKPVELRAGPCGPAQYAVRSPTGHWNFCPYGARKLPGSSM